MLNAVPFCMNSESRVALFADTFHEVNGAANVLRRLKAFANENSREFLCICAGSETKLDRSGRVWTLELKRSRMSLPMNGDLRYDPTFWRYTGMIRDVLTDFDPDIVHVTGINDVSQIGYYLSHKLKLRAVASWHTNVHEYLTRRLAKAVRFLPKRASAAVLAKTEKLTLKGIMKVHGIAKMQLAPNEELVRMLQKGTNRQAALMSRGVDTDFLSPAKRTRPDSDTQIVLGFVGRLQPEKNVRFLERIDSALKASGLNNYRWLIVGEGCETRWLSKNLTNVTLTGTLHGADLSQAYADMDLFVFPSRTDAFGNVVLEAMASGVPAIVMPDHGPKYLIKSGVDGVVARDETDFVDTVVESVSRGRIAPAMRSAARSKALEYSWQSVFEQLYRNYALTAKIRKGDRQLQTEYTTAEHVVKSI